MKKILLSVLSVVLCLCLVVPIGVTAFAKNEEAPTAAETNITLEEYLADAEANGNKVQVVGDTLGKLGDAFESLSSTSFKTVFMKALAKAINVLSNTLVNNYRQGSRSGYPQDLRYQ